MPARTTRAYKDVTFQQLRSFCEVARLGSLKAAASFLKIAQPTVWKQVHALEQQFSTKLIETHSRGCLLTEAGRLLAELAAPSVADIGALGRRFREAMAGTTIRLTVATTQYALIEHLPESVKMFERSHPNVLMSLVEMGTANAPHFPGIARRTTLSQFRRFKGPAIGSARPIFWL